MSGSASIDAAALKQHTQDDSRAGSLWALLQAELSSYPGRPLLVFRIVLACTIVMLCIMVFRIPGAALGAYYPLLVSRDNLHSTKRSAFSIAAASTLGAVEVVLGAMLFIGSPVLHLAWVCVSLCAVFYLVSTFRVYEAALALGLFITTTITIWDQQLSADVRLRQTLFTLLAILIGCAVSVVIEYLFSHTHPPDAVIGGIQQRLGLAARVLQEDVADGAGRAKLVHDLRRSSRRGTGALRELILQSDYGFEEQQRLSTAVALAGRLIDLASTFAEMGSTLSAGDRERSAAIGRNIALIHGSLSHKKVPEWIDIDSEHEAGAPILIEIERTVDLLAESLSQPTWEGGEAGSVRRLPEPARRIFVDDALSSTRHVKFAIRGGASAIVCYLFYMSAGWVGLSASVATCVLTALPITGAARHKQLLRFAGVVVGACVLGFTAQAIILPQIDSILSYTLLFAVIIALGAWIATSGPRIAYCGAQIVLAYELVNLNHFSINPSLVPARDTVLGIVLGIVVMWFIFDHLWATTSVESLRSMLGTTIREIAELEVAPSQQTAGSFLLERRTHEIMGRFERLRTLADVSIFEAFPKAVPDEALLQRTSEYLPQLRAILLIKTGLMHHRSASGGFCQSDIAVRVQRRCSELLIEAAREIEQDTAGTQIAFTSADREIQSRLRADTARVRSGELTCDLTELRLSSSLFDVVRHLASMA